MDEALYLTELAAKVTVVHRGDQLRATRVLQERAMAQPKIAWRWHTVVEGIEGSEQVERLRLTDVHTGESSLCRWLGCLSMLACSLTPNFCKCAAVGCWRACAGQPAHGNATPRLYAAGDLRQHSARQVISSAGDGATAACFAMQYLRSAG